MTIQSSVQVVYYAPTKGRRYFSKSAAINAEARAIIKKHVKGWPPHDCSEEECGWCRDPGWSCEQDQPERHARYMRMLTKALRSTME